LSNWRRLSDIAITPTQYLEVLRGDRRGFSDPGGDGIHGAFPATKGRGANPQRLSHLGCRQIASLPKLEHPPGPSEVLVAMHVARSPAPVVPSLELDHPTAAALADVLTLVLTKPAEGGGGQ